MSIKEMADSVRYKYKTRDPFQIATHKNIDIMFLPLGEIKGYYSQCYRHKCIHINSELNQIQRRYTCAHELAHAILHSQSNTPFMQTNTLFCVNKFENEANYFAVDLLISDEDLAEYRSQSTFEIANMFGIDERFVEYRLKSLNI